LMLCTKLYYKHLSGDYFTASAFGFWVACNVLRSGRIPQLLKPVGTPPEEVRNMLIYNQFRGKGQSLILLQKV
ncbi:MAG: beta-ketoacyl synthase, partial [Bacteroidetes bacterium]|nr:beta-ketoacyl synthase [Bacteroidota bacterium]